MKNSTEVISFKASINYITFFQDILRNFLKKSKRVLKKEAQEKYKHICFSLKYSINKHIENTVVFTKLAVMVVRITAVVGAVVQLIQSQELEFQLIFQEKNLSIFTVHVLRELYQKNFEDNVIDQTESN